MEYIEMINDKIFMIWKLKWALVKGPMITFLLKRETDFQSNTGYFIILVVRA